jgi:hypothetical protein
VTGAGPEPSGRATKVIAYAAALIILAAATWALQTATAYPWAGLLAAVVLAAVALSGAGFLSVVQQIITTLTQRRTVRIIAIVAVVLLVAAIGGPPAWRWVWRAVSGGPAFAGGCAHPAELRLLTSIDGLEPTRELAVRYEQWTSDVDRSGCPAVHAFVYAAPTAAAATSAIAKGWNDDDRQRPLVTVGPRPDAWLADSTVDVREVRDLAGRAQLPLPIRSSASLGSSPIVLASKLALAGADQTWSQVLSKASGDGATVLVPDPKTSSAGLLAAAGYLSDPAGAPVTLAVARERVRAVVAAGSDGEGAAGLLCRWNGTTTGPGSVVLSNQTWLRFVTGRRPPSGCAAGPAQAGVRVIPTGTPVLDHPLVEFTWSTAAQQSLVEEFRRWLSGPIGRDALTAAGLGPARPDCSGLDANPCVPANLDPIRELFTQAQKPGRVLLALDTSGSMAEQGDPAGPTRFDVAARAVRQAVGRMGRTDQFGLWTFPAAADGRGQRSLVDIGVGTEQHRTDVVTALETVQPAGGTPLYDTIIAGLRAVSDPVADVDPRSLIVLTDGQDTTSGVSAADARASVAELVRTTGVRLYVIAIGEASCTGPQGLRELAATGLGGCFDADPGQLADTVGHLFEVLWKGQ